MRLHRGQIFENTLLKREAMVIEIQNGGQMGLLRFIDTNEDEWVSSEEIDADDEWHLKTGPGGQG